MESPITNASQTTADTSSTSTAQENSYYPEEEITEGNWKIPKVNVVDVKVVTGEENESIFWSQRSKLYRWKSGEWKQRGLGEAKLLENKTSGKIRFLLRQEKTFKIVANHFVIPSSLYCNLSPNSGSDKIWVWATLDYAEEAPENEQFALKFGTVEQANIFKTKFEEAGKKNLEIIKPVTSKASDKTPDTETQSKDDAQTPKSQDEVTSAEGSNKTNQEVSTQKTKSSDVINKQIATNPVSESDSQKVSDQQEAPVQKQNTSSEDTQEMTNEKKQSTSDS